MSILRIASFFALGITATALAVGVPGSSSLNESESGLDSHQAGRKSQTSKDWAALTKQDVQTIHDAYKSSHPGMLNKDDPNFASNLERATEQHLALAQKATTQAGHHAVLNRYMATFRDDHSQWRVVDENFQPKPDTTPIRWPGFVLGARNGTVMVVASKGAGAPPVGSALQSCDGTPTKRLLKDRVDPYSFDTGVPGNLIREARYLLLDQGNPFLPPLKLCSFAIGQQPAKTYALRWVLQTEADKALFDRSIGESVSEASVSISQDNIAWIAFPTFLFVDLTKPLENIKKQIAAIRKAKAIIIDLRGNGGGSSDWGNQLARTLWGEKFVEYKTWNDAYPEWRTSQANVDWFKFLSKPEVGLLAPDQVEKFAKPLIAALEPRVPDADTKLWAKQDDLSARPAKVETQFPKLPVYVLQDAVCASACLDTMDVLRNMPNVKFLGQVTDADTNYLEVRFQLLPSGEGGFSTPMKVWRNRPRASGQAYQPDVTNPELDWSEKAVRAWALKVIRQK
jgi:Peptidase family S41